MRYWDFCCLMIMLRQKEVYDQDLVATHLEKFLTTELCNAHKSETVSLNPQEKFVINLRTFQRPYYGAFGATLAQGRR